MAMRALALSLIFSVSACAPPAAPSDADFARVIGGRSAGPARSCVTAGSGDSLRAVDSMTLAYGSGATIYVNRLGASCPGLRDFSTIIVDAHGGAYCRGDRIRALELGAIIPGPSCILGDWVPYRTLARRP